MAQPIPNMTDFYGYPDPLLLPAGTVGRGRAEMAVYDYLMRPSMGHRMQVELKESTQQYTQEKVMLRSQLKELRMDSHDLHTSPLPPLLSPTHSVKRWNKRDKFYQAPNKVEKKAKLAKLGPEVDKDGKGLQLLPLESIVVGSFLSEDDKRTKIRFGANAELLTPRDKEGKGHNMKTATEVRARKSALKEMSASYSLKFPTIHSASAKRAQYYSGNHYLHVKGMSVPLEKLRVGEECQAFSQSTVAVPHIVDPKRTEITLPPILSKSTDALTKASFTARQPKKASPIPTMEVLYNGTVSNSLNNSICNFIDHFPQEHTGRFPELEDASTLTGDEDDEERKRIVDRDDDLLEMPPLPVVRLSKSKLSKHNFAHTTRLVPRIKLDRRTSPSVISAGTGRTATTGVTAATYMSQETLEWKCEYMTTADPEYKNRMLGNILHMVRQRMHDNQEELRINGRMDTTLLFDTEDASRNINERSNATQIRVPKKKKKKPESKLQSYLHKLSSKRKVMEHRHREKVRFQLAHMTIREITLSTINPRSTVHTSASAAKTIPAA